jgi:hypothetical protein
MASDAQLLQTTLARERRLLLDPVEDPIDEWVSLDFADPLCRIIPTQAAASDRSGSARVSETITFFGLNTIPELIEDRFTAVNAALEDLEAWRDGSVAKAEELRVQANRYKPHGWAIRRVLVALAPDLELPTAADDLHSLVQETLKRLDRDDLVLAGNITEADREMVQKRRQEACWTLAVLWKTPPAASPAQVGNWIDQHGRRAEIELLRNQI